MHKIGFILLLCLCCVVSVKADTLSIDTTRVQDMSDVRELRDSLKHAMRTARRFMHSDIRSLRDSVRQDLCDMARRRPHLLRVGWGDQMFETLVWYNQTHSTLYPESYIGQYEERYRYTQHWLAEYQYRVRNFVIDSFL